MNTNKKQRPKREAQDPGRSETAELLLFYPYLIRRVRFYRDYLYCARTMITQLKIAQKIPSRGNNNVLPMYAKLTYKYERP